MSVDANAKLEAEILSKLGMFPQGIVESALVTRLREAKNYQHCHSVLMSMEKRDGVMFGADNKWRLSGRPLQDEPVVVVQVAEPEPEPEIQAEPDLEPEAEPEPELEHVTVRARRPGKTREIVLAALAVPMSIAELAKHLDLKPATANYNITQLFEAGLIVRAACSTRSVPKYVAAKEDEVVLEPMQSTARTEWIAKPMPWPAKPATLGEVVAKHGLTPRTLFDEQVIFRRIEDITSAMLLSTNAGKPVPAEWVVELAQRTDQLKQCRSGQEVTL